MRKQCVAFVFMLITFPFVLPATAQTTTIWQTTLTVDVDEGNSWFGCDSTLTTVDDCSDALSDEFTWDGTSYTVEVLVWYDGTDVVILGFEGLTGPEEKTAFSAATLKLDGSAFMVADTNPLPASLVWQSIDNPGWTDGQEVSVSLTIPGADDPPVPDPDPVPDPEPSNAAPTVTISAGSTTAAPGGTVALTATATDSDGTIVSYGWAARPVGRSSYSTTTGKFSHTSAAETVWTAPASLGEYRVRVRVRDNGGATAAANVLITVEDAEVEDVEPVPALPAAGLALLAFLLAARGARHGRTRAVGAAD